MQSFSLKKHRALPPTERKNSDKQELPSKKAQKAKLEINKLKTKKTFKILLKKRKISKFEL